MFRRKLLFAMSILGIALFATPAAAYNIALNGGFEVDENNDGIADDWTYVNNYPNDYFLDDSVAHSGSYSLRMHTYNHPNNGRLSSSGGAFQWYDIEPDTEYRLSYWVRSADPDHVDASVGTNEYDAPGGTKTAYHYAYIDIDEAYVWKQVEYQFTTTAATETLSQFYLMRSVFDTYVDDWKEGEYRVSWIDDVVFERADSIDTPVPASWLLMLPGLGVFRRMRRG